MSERDTSQPGTPQTPTKRAPDPAAAPAIDPAALAQLRAVMGDDDDAVDEVIDAFVTSTPNLLAALRIAAGAGDAAGVQGTAHSLKSSSATVGALTLVALCKALEAMGRAGRIEGAREKVAQVEAEYGRVKGALEAERGRGR